MCRMAVSANSVILKSIQVICLKRSALAAVLITLSVTPGYAMMPVGPYGVLNEVYWGAPIVMSASHRISRVSGMAA